MLLLIQELVKDIPNGIYCLVAAYLLWKIAQFYFVRFRDVEKKGEEVSDIKKKIDDNIEPLLTKIHSTSDRIARYIITRDELDPAFFSAKSPVELSDLAREVLEKSSAKSFVDNDIDFLTLKIDERNPKSSLDIQQLAISVIFELVDTEAFSKIKDFIYQNPKYKGENIGLLTMINIIALYLRDKYFEKHPGLKENNLE